MENVNTELSPTRFDAEVFPQYGRLSFGERLFLRTCCYFPPRPPRVRTLENVSRTEHYEAEYERAFGPAVWSLIAGREVLDVGCGEGGHVMALAARGAGFVTGLDVRPEFRHAEQESRRRGYPVRFIEANTEALPDAAFGVVISHDSFEHFAEPERMLAEMTRLTRPGGRLLIKFGPPWRNPWGRHMTGTIRRDRPWIHLIMPERTIMRAQSVYFNKPTLDERFADLPGGLNKMTVSRFKGMLFQQEGVRIEQFKVFPLYSIGLLVGIPLVREFFASGVRAICIRK
jgi:2-polyprenyl-3-methyl-5-hydroxy-6-metoxy-1,4-benzoquinol methylase